MRLEYDDQLADLVPNSVDHRQFFAPARSKQRTPTVEFLMYSTFQLKGVDLSIEVLGALREKLRELRIVSFGSEYPSNSLKLPNGSDFFLSPPQDTIRHLYSQCDVWLTASRSEGFNLPAMEAMACRNPVVATKIRDGPG